MSHTITHLRARRHVTPLNPDTVARWRDHGRLTAADVAAILAERDPADLHPIAGLVARLRQVTS